MNTFIVEEGIREIAESEIESVSGGGRLVGFGIGYLASKGLDWLLDGGYRTLGNYSYNAVMSIGASAVSGLSRLQNRP